MESETGKAGMQADRPDPERVVAARARMRVDGLNAKSWAIRNRESVDLTRKVLSGQRACMMGASRRIAIKLGIIDGAPAAEPVHA